MSDRKLVNFEFSYPSPDLLEAEARRLPSLDLAPAASSGWRQRYTRAGVNIRLPDGFEEAEPGSSDQTMWRHRDGSVVTVIAHEGGEYSLLFADTDEQEVVWSDEGAFRISAAGRVAKLTLAHTHAGAQAVFFASASVGIAVGLSVAVVLAAPSAEARANLLNVIPTVTINDHEQNLRPGAER
jgi:hypothetical protein